MAAYALVVIKAPLLGFFKRECLIFLKFAILLVVK